MSKRACGFVLGTVFGAALGAVAGILLAPKSGEETRAAAAEAARDAWDQTLESYDKMGIAVNERVEGFRPVVDSAADELRAKVDQAREKMDQLRDSLSNLTDDSVIIPVEEVAESTEVSASAAPASE